MKRFSAAQPLHEALPETGPFGRVHDARNDIEGPGTIDRGASHRGAKGHPDGAYLPIGGLLPLGQGARTQVGQMTPEGVGHRPGLTVRSDDLVVPGPQLIRRPRDIDHHAATPLVRATGRRAVPGVSGPTNVSGVTFTGRRPGAHRPTAREDRATAAGCGQVGRFARHAHRAIATEIPILRMALRVAFMAFSFH